MKSADKLQDIDREAGIAIFYNIAKKPHHYSASTLLFIHPHSSFSFHRKEAYIIRYIYKIIKANIIFVFLHECHFNYFIGDVLVRMMEEKDRDTCRTLFGHSGPVYKVAFDPFKTMLLSCSEDSTGKS